MSQDRKQLIRIAAARPVGDPVRRVLLAELQKSATARKKLWWHEEAINNILDKANYGYGSESYRKFFKALDKAERRKLPRNQRSWVKEMVKLIVDSGKDDERSANRNVRDFLTEVLDFGDQAHEDPRNTFYDYEGLERGGYDELIAHTIQEVNKL